MMIMKLVLLGSLTSQTCLEDWPGPEMSCLCYILEVAHPLSSVHSDTALYEEQGCHNNQVTVTDMHCTLYSVDSVTETRKTRQLYLKTTI